MSVKIGTKTNKKTGKLLRTSQNITKLTGNTSSLAGLKLAFENDVCCGLGRKTLYFVGLNGQPKKITKYPVIFNDQVVHNAKELGEQITKYLGVGYIAYVPNVGNAEVIAANYQKEAGGTLSISDTLVIKEVTA